MIDLISTKSLDSPWSWKLKTFLCSFFCSGIFIFLKTNSLLFLSLAPGHLLTAKQLASELQYECLRSALYWHNWGGSNAQTLKECGQETVWLPKHPSDTHNWGDFFLHQRVFSFRIEFMYLVNSVISLFIANNLFVFGQFLNDMLIKTLWIA